MKFDGENLMRKFLLAIMVLVLVSICVPCAAQGRRSLHTNKTRSAVHPKYIGCWSDGSYGVLFINVKKIKFGFHGKWVKYIDVTETQDGKLYLLKLSNPGEFNFLSNVVSLSLDGEKMQMTLYDSLEDFSNGKKSGWDTWYKDRCWAK